MSSSYGNNAPKSIIRKLHVILLAKYLAKKTVNKRKTEKGLINLINFN